MLIALVLYFEMTKIVKGTPSVQGFKSVDKTRHFICNLVTS